MVRVWLRAQDHISTHQRLRSLASLARFGLGVIPSVLLPLGCFVCWPYSSFRPHLWPATVRSRCIPSMPPSRRSRALLWLSSSNAFAAPRTRPVRAAALQADAISDFCQGTNKLWKSLIIPVVRDYADVKPKGTADVDDFFSVVTAAPDARHPAARVADDRRVRADRSHLVRLVQVLRRGGVAIAFCLGNVSCPSLVG